MGGEGSVRGHYSHVSVEVGGVVPRIVKEGGQVGGRGPAEIDIHLCVGRHCKLSGKI